MEAIPLRVLVVEDSESDTALLIRLLQQDGYATTHIRVETEENMAVALEQGDWDVVISDYSMPLFDAPRALGVLHATQRDIPFIVVSGSIGEDIAVQMMKAGAQDYVMKDKPARLVAAVKRELREAGLRREKRQADEELAINNEELRAINEELESTYADLEQSSAELKESETRYRRLFEAARDGILILDAGTGMIVDANPFLIELLGFSIEQFLGKKVWELGFFNDLVANHDEFIELQRRGYVRYEDKPLRTADGRKIDVEFVSNVYMVNDGKVIQCNIRDITERKLIEDALVFMLACGNAKTGEEFFDSLARYLALKLGMDYVCIDRLLDGNLAAETLSVYFDGEIEDNVTYTLKDTPCGDVVGKNICCFTRGVRHLFPCDEALHQLAAEGYIGTTLWSSTGQPIGLIALISRHPLENSHLAESVLKLVAVRAAGELERKRAEEALSKTQHSQQALLDSIPDMAWLKDEQSTFISVNQKLALSLELLQTEIPGKNDYDFYPRELANAYREDDQSVMSSGKSRRVEEVYVGSDGKEKWIETIKVPFLNDAGQVVGTAGIARDITERKASEQALADAAVRSRILVEQSGDGIVILDSSGKVVEANLSYAHMLGYTMEEVHRLHVWDWDDKWTREQLLEIIGSVDADGIHLETIHRRKDGSLLDVQVSSNGAICGGEKLVFCVCRDITERKQAEEALLRSETRFRTLYDTSSDAVMLVDEKGFFDCNASALRMFGCSDKAEFCSHHPADFSLSHQPGGTDSMLLADQRIGQAMEEGSLRFEWMHKRVDTQAVFPAEVLLSRMHLDGKHVVQATVRDITERKKAEAELRQAQKLEAIGQLAAGIAHEINTPMQYISSNTISLKDSLDSLLKYAAMFEPVMKQVSMQNEESAAIAQAISAAREIDINYLISEIPLALDQTLEGIGRVTKIVGAMREFSHPGTDEKTLVDLNKTIESSITVTRNEWKHVADVKTELDPQLPALSCYSGDINQVLVNLLTNSAHAIADVVRNQPDAKGLITVSTRLVGDSIELRVGDTGAGIPEAIRDRIFEPFFTTKDVGMGTGQGLAIAHAAIVGRHGGTISLESNIGGGTTFIVLLPLHPVTRSVQ